jgi:hypothetical protein
MMGDHAQSDRASSCISSPVVIGHHPSRDGDVVVLVAAYLDPPFLALQSGQQIRRGSARRVGDSGGGVCQPDAG